MHHCFKNLVAHREATHAYISPEDWDRNAHLGWYPGADGPGHYRFEPDYSAIHNSPDPLIVFRRVEQCPTCGERI